jgi:LppP/LprE lipoprotein
MSANTVAMTSTAKRHRALLAGLAASLLALGGCGSGGTKTVSVSSAIPSGTPTQSTTTTGTTRSSPTTTTHASTSPPATGQGGVEATRTTTAPAFTKQTAGGEGLGTALAVVKAHGYTAGGSSDYHPNQTLRVLVGTRTGSGDGYGQQAFFFVGGHYLGTDTSEPSASVKVVGQSDTEVTLAYPLYRPHDPLCCASAGQAVVRFQLNNGRLVPLNPIPPAHSTTAASRQ